MPTLDRHLIDAANAAQRMTHLIAKAQTGGNERMSNIVSARVLALAVLEHLNKAQSGAKPDASFMAQKRGAA